MNAAKNAASFYNTIHDLISCIDWDCMKLHMWNNTDEYPNRMDRRMAEFLILDHISWMDFLGVAVYDEAHKAQLTSLYSRLSGDIRIEVKRDWYF
jgi:hypothetical protein